MKAEQMPSTPLAAPWHQLLMHSSLTPHDAPTATFGSMKESHAVAPDVALLFSGSQVSALYCGRQSDNRSPWYANRPWLSLCFSRVGETNCFLTFASHEDWSGPKLELFCTSAAAQHEYILAHM